VCHDIPHFSVEALGRRRRAHGVMGLPPRVAAGARWVAVASTITTTTAAATAAAVSSTSRRSVAASGSATETSTTIAALGSSSPSAGTAAEATTAAAHTTNIAVGRASTTTTTTAATTAAAAAKAGAFTGDALEEGRDLLVSLLQQVEEIANDTAVATVEERGGDTSVSGTTGTTNTMNVVVNVGGKIVVYDVGDCVCVSLLYVE
jgi:hypothetical protein